MRVTTETRSTTPRAERPPSAPDRRGRRPLARLRRAQHQLALLLGVDEDRRSETVLTMLENNARRAPGYWIQLFLATGIATLGLVLDSTAVVIGGMLVSPLMGPIVELGMGFAIGSSLLVIRATLRVLLSVVGVTALAAFITLALPFHEVTSELAARSAPTALDLLVAMFCALAAAYTTVRHAADTTAAAAGTAIGIALVPPLCTVGFGIGTAAGAIAGGATLLFVANFSAILVFAVGSFLLLGFNAVDAPALENNFTFQRGRVTTMAARAEHALRDAFGSRYGMAMRVVVPVVFLAGVYVPLRRALDEVSWEVRTRAAIRRVLNIDDASVMQTMLQVERQGVTVHLLLVGSPDSASALQRRLETRIAAVSGVAPTVSVTAVPDVRALNAMSLAQAKAGEQAARQVFIPSAREQIEKAVSTSWVESALGPLLGWELAMASNGTAVVAVRHAGSPMGVAAESLMAHTLSTQLSYPVAVRDAPIAAEVLALGPRTAASEAAWIRSAAALLGVVAVADSSAHALACVTRPASAAQRPTRGDRAVQAAIDSSSAARAGRVVLIDGDAWRVRLAKQRC